MSQAVTAKHVVELENSLAEAEEAEVTAHSELYGIADRTTLASITATLTQRDRESRPPSPILASMKGALGALKATGLALAGAAIWLLAFVWAWLPLLWLGLRAARRRAALRAA